MIKVGRWWGFMLLSCTTIVLCHAEPQQIDPFLTLGSPSLVSNQVQFTLTGEAPVTYVIESSLDLNNWVPVATNSSPEITRDISLGADPGQAAFYRAWRNPLPMFPGALVARSNITLSGNSITVDSYDSGDTNYSTPGGFYDHTKRKAGGDVISTEGLVDVGNATIKGVLCTSLFNSGQYSVGPTGSVGGLAWTGPGIQPGWYQTNFHWALPDVSPPYLTGIVPTGSISNVWELGSADYLYDGNFAANSSSTIYVAGNATMFVAGNFDCKGKILIAPGASLKLYVGGLYTRLNQVLTAGHPMSFQYYGLPTNGSFSWVGNDEFVGIIYAPKTSVRMGGGGSVAFDFQGACVAKSVSLNGHFNFHYDENLKRIGPMR